MREGGREGGRTRGRVLIHRTLNTMSRNVVPMSTAARILAYFVANESRSAIEGRDGMGNELLERWVATAMLVIVG